MIAHMLQARLILMTTGALLSANLLRAASPQAGAEGGSQVTAYSGLRPSDHLGRLGLPNPERGFRLEERIAEGKDPRIRKDVEQFARTGVRLAQTYCYLNEFCGKRISDEKVKLLQDSFEVLREVGIKAVLRFAYEFDSTGKTGPTLEDFRVHLAQLKPVILQNKDVILVVQAGFIGLWGEWHHSVHGLDKDLDAQAELVRLLLDAVPADRQIQLRRPAYIRRILGEEVRVTAATAHGPSPVARLSFHNDYFLAGKHGWDLKENSPDFRHVGEVAAYLMSDGEMPWGSDRSDIPAFDSFRMMAHAGYTSFSIAHNYREGGKEWALARWESEPLDAAVLRGANLPFSEAYFEGADGQPVQRSAFEYVRDHLGYRIELKQAEWPADPAPGAEVALSVKLVNFGFATLHNPRPVLFVLVGADDTVIEIPTSADPRDWQPHAPGDAARKPLVHKVSARARLPAGQWRVGLWLPDAGESIRMRPEYAVRVANRDVPWWTDRRQRYGVNILGTLTAR